MPLPIEPGQSPPPPAPTDDEFQGTYEKVQQPNSDEDDESGDIYDNVEDVEREISGIEEELFDVSESLELENNKHISWYTVYGQADVNRDYTPQNTDDEMDFLKLQVRPNFDFP